MVVASATLGLAANGKSLPKFTAIRLRGLFLTRISSAGGEEGEVPRINIDDDWFLSPRRRFLEGKVGLSVDTVALAMWRLAQTYYRQGVLTVPTEEYELMPHWKEFEEARLARRESGGVYICGSRQAFDWIKKKRKSGSLGGLARAKHLLADAKQNVASSSSSSSFSKKEESEPSVQETVVVYDSEFSPSSRKPPSLVKKKKEPSELYRVRAAFGEKYKKKYGVAPQWLQKDFAEAKRLVDWAKNNANGEGPEQKVLDLMDSYLASDDELNVKNRHPFSTLANRPERYYRKTTLQAGPRRMVSESAS